MRFLTFLNCAILAGNGIVWTSPVHAQMTYPPTLMDEIAGQPISATTTKCIVLIHGWNPSGAVNPYDHEAGFELFNLLESLRGRVNGSGWGIVAYDWHKDAATGGIWSGLWNFEIVHASTAAFNADAHGVHLAGQLNQMSPNLREVHFIAHSAGSWAARAAAQTLLKINPYVVVQVTLLDPFVPDPGSLLYGGDFSDAAMDGTKAFSGSERIQRLENYYSDDSPEHGWNAYPWGNWTGPTYNTQERFSWRSGIDLNQQIDWGSVLINPPGPNSLTYTAHYDWHSGPIQFYSDTVSAALFPNAIPSGVSGTGCPFNYQDIAWSRSLYSWEAMLPEIVVQPPSQSAQSGGSVTLQVSANQGASYEWYKIGGGYVGSGSSLTLNHISADSAGSYVVRVSNANGQLFSQPAMVMVSAAIADTPSSLSAAAVSSSQINLTWGNVANETGFKIERRLGSSGSWSQITTLSANVLGYSDTGLAPGTAYSYRVRAYNAEGNSDYSPIASATTQSPAGTSYTLTIASSNPASGVAVNSFVGNGSFASGTTPTSRSFPSGTAVDVTCPPTLVGGLVFQKWQLDEKDYASSTLEPYYTTVTLNSAHTLTAIYGTTPPPAKVLSSLSIEGPSTLGERTSAQYQARANYSDGSSGYVNPQWTEDSSYASISSAGLLDTSAVTSDTDVLVEAKFTVGDVTKTASKAVTINNTDAVPTYTLTLAATHGDISVKPQMAAYPWGTEVRLTASADDDYVFDHWSGDASGTDYTVYVIMNGNRSVTANFSADTSYGRLQVTLLPQEAAKDGAQWMAFPFTSWYDSGHQIEGVTPKRYYVSFKEIPGWVAPQNIPVDVAGGATAQVTGTYQEIPGTVQVTIEPAAVATAGVRWRLDDGAWQPSETTLTGVPSGTHQIEFESTPGWSTPTPLQITVARAGVTIRTGQYTPPPGLPLVTAVSPKTGPIAGGTLLTIEGANFLPSSAVFVGGRAASRVTFLSASRLTAVTPASSVFGSAEIVVSNGTSRTTNANAFAYGIPRGTNMTLITSSGGMYQAVACNNQYLFIGQGTTLSIFDISTPSSPIFRGSVVLPGLIQDIALSGSFAIVAANDAGVHVVDVSNVSTPTLRGFYGTKGSAVALKILAGRAYVVDMTNGLVILDVSNPDGLVALSNLTLGSVNWDIALKASVTGFHAYISAKDEVYVVDVADPTKPVGLAAVAGPSGDNWSIALAGNLALLGHLGGGGVGAIDISDPTNPINVGPFFSSQYVTVASFGNRVVLGAWTQSLDIADVSGTTVTLRGSLSNGDVSFDPNGGQRMAIANGVAWIAARTAIFGVNISNPDAPQRIFRKDDQGGRFEKVAISGSNLAVATVGSLFGYSYLGNTITPVAALAYEGQSQGMVVAQGVLLDFRNVYYGDVNGERVRRTSTQFGTLFQSLTPAVLPQMYAVDAYTFGDRVISVCAAHSDNHAIISEHDPNRTDAAWILRQKDLPFRTGGGGAQIAGAPDFFFLGYFDSLSGKWTLASYNWAASTPAWQISGLETINALQLSGNNRFLHVGEQFKYHIYDVIDPANPVLLSTSATGNGISDILVDGDDVYLAAYNLGVLVYDIGDKDQPRLTRSYNTPGQAMSVAKIGDRLIVADYQAGIQVLGLPDIIAPQVFITSPVALSQFQTTDSSITLGGGADDNSGQISRVIWSNDRGGGGVAEGTTDWLVSAMNVQPGTNIVTVTAFDAEGNSATDQITVISTPHDTTPPVVTITGPSPDNEFVVRTSMVTLSGSADDNQSVTSLTWSNDRGGSGAALISSSAWKIENLPLAIGPNLIVLTATDSSGNIGSATVVISFQPPDGTAPIITIEFPTLNAVYETESSTVNLSGMATDNSGVAKVEWSNARGGQGMASGVAPWSINDIQLQPGLNVIEVTATDIAGNSSSDTLSVTFIIPIPNLSVMRADSNLVFRWPANVVGFLLESTPKFPATNWAPESSAPPIVNGQYTFTTEITDDKRFYRLRKP